MPNGKVRNHSSKALWVVESARAHKLPPGHESPSGIDADGFKAFDGVTPIDGHLSWVKIIDLSTADVRDDGSNLTRGCYLCTNVEDDEFGDVTFDPADGWGDANCLILK